MNGQVPMLSGSYVNLVCNRDFGDTHDTQKTDLKRETKPNKLLCIHPKIFQHSPLLKKI